MPTAFMMCDIPATARGAAPRAWRRGHSTARVTHVPATIQPPREVGLAQESRR